MKKIILFATVFVLPFMIQAQEIGLSESYRSKKQLRLSKYKPLQSGDVTFNAGLGTIKHGYGLSYSLGAEYMINNKLGVRAFYTTNNLNGIGNWGGTSRASVDMTYHFIQTKRWDVYAFLGLGVERMHYRWFNGGTHESLANNRPTFNAGVGARYKITPNFGLQAETGRVSNFGVFKKFSLKRKK